MERFNDAVILCPTDFSDHAAYALRFAASLAESAGGTLIVLYADPFLPPPYFTRGQVDAVMQGKEQSKSAALVALDAHVKETLGDRAHLTVQSLVAESLPVPAILASARDHRAGLIVMGTHGRSGINRVMLGSVAERVLREARLPVITVKMPGEGTRQAISPIRSILCPVNWTETAHQALDAAVTLAEQFSAEIRVLHVVEEATTETSTDVESKRLCAWVPQERRGRCEIHEVIRSGNAAAEILKEAGEQRCDLLVLGAQHKRFHDSTILGVTTVRVTRHAPCPVLTITSWGE